MTWDDNPNKAVYQPLTWFKFSVDISDTIGTGPFALDLSGMGKGAAWVNGHPIGRYWNITGTGQCKPCFNISNFS